MDWYILAAAVATATAVHGAMEPRNVNDKLARLGQAIKTGKVRKPMIEGIDTRAKSYAIGVFMLGFMTAISYAIINWADPTLEAAMQYTVGVLLVGELVLIAGLDAYHVAIEKLTQAQAKKK